MTLARTNGFSLVEVMVAVALFGLIVVGSTYLAPDSISKLSRKAAREQLVVTIQKYSAMAGVIRNSARQSTNPQLRMCLTIDVPGEADCQNGTVYPVTLYGPFQGNGVSGADGKVSGPPGTPVQYTSAGAQCTTACNFSVSTTFRVTCPLALPTLVPMAVCDQADLIEVSYSIVEISSPAAPITGAVATSMKTIFNQ